MVKYNNGQYKISGIASIKYNGSEYALKTYNIAPTLTNVTAGAGNPTTIQHGGTATLTFTANSGYNLPATVTVTGASYTWTQATGTLVLSNPTNNILLTVSGEPATVQLNFTVPSSTDQRYLYIYENEEIHSFSSSGSYDIKIGVPYRYVYAFYSSTRYKWTYYIPRFTIDGTVQVPDEGAVVSYNVIGNAVSCSDSASLISGTNTAPTVTFNKQ